MTRVCGLAIRLLAAFAEAADALNTSDTNNAHAKGRGSGGGGSGGGGGGGSGSGGDDGSGHGVHGVGVALMPLLAWPIWLTSSNELVNGSMIRMFDDEIMALPNHVRYAPIPIYLN